MLTSARQTYRAFDRIFDLKLIRMTNSFALIVLEAYNRCFGVDPAVIRPHVSFRDVGGQEQIIEVGCDILESCTILRIF